MSATRLSPVSFLRHCADVATFYGFSPMREVEKGLPTRRGRGGFHSFATSVEVCAARVTAQKSLDPVLAFWASAAPSHLPAQAGALSGASPREVGEFGLHVMGCPESLGEILLLKTLFAIMEEWGTPISAIRLNAPGDKDSRARFERELLGYIRRHLNELDPECRKSASEKPLLLYSCAHESCRAVVAEAPRAMHFLSEKSRIHFREVLEYIENLGLPYEVDDLLVGDEREPRLAFALAIENSDATVLAGMGGRYDDHLRSVTNKKEGSVVSASLFFRKKGIGRSVVPTKVQHPKIYFVQLGLRAKLQGLLVIDMLRAAQVPVAQSFDAHSLAPQLLSAKAQGVKHLLIMGQREALDGTVIVRSMLNSQQTIVPLTTLPRYLKNLKV
jgi:histidyl-tRNA synthetase